LLRVETPISIEKMGKNMGYKPQNCPKIGKHMDQFHPIWEIYIYNTIYDIVLEIG
jgi:hypothetical protein